MQLGYVKLYFIWWFTTSWIISPLVEEPRIQAIIISAKTTPCGGRSCRIPSLVVI